jgi:hypothetical protein
MAASSDQSGALPNPISFGIAVGDLSHAVWIRLPIGRLESPVGYLGDECIEVIDEDRLHGVAGVLGPLLNIE